MALNQLLNRHTKVFYQNLNYRGMGVTIFMHPTLWCLLFECLPTCWSITLHYTHGFATIICQQLRCSTDNTGFVLTTTLFVDTIRMSHGHNIVFIALQTTEGLRDVRSDIQLIWVFARTLKRAPNFLN